MVRVGDNAAVGLEPLREEQLPAYEKDSNTQFYALDLEKIGGLQGEGVPLKYYLLPPGSCLARKVL